MPQPATDAIVVGGGIIGMLTARALRMAGASVVLLERAEVGKESTWAGGGIISPLYPWRYPDAVTRLANWGQAHYSAIAEELAEFTGVSPEWTRNGLLILDEDEKDQALAWAERHGRRVESINAERALELEPALARTEGPALWMEDVAQVRNPRVGRSLRLDIERRGVEVRENVSVEALSLEAGRAVGVQVAGETLRAGQVVVCAGAWSAGLLSLGGVSAAVRPVRGQMILFRARPDDLRRITLFDGHYTIPRRDGRVLMGSTLEEVGFDKSTTVEARDELWRRAVGRFPLLGDCEVEHHWAGLRPGSPGGVPYIGAHPEVSGLFVNAGHYRNGVVLGPASARLAADLMLGRDPVVDPAPYALTASR